MVLDLSHTRIVVDSSSNVPEALQRQYRMLEVPAIVNFGAESFRNNVDLSADEFYRRFATVTQPPTTSQPPPKFFADAYRQAFAEGAEFILAVSVSSRLSGTFASSLTAAQEFGLDRFLVWDSNSASMGSGWQAVAAARLLEEGVEHAALIEHLSHLREAVYGYITVETLKYAAMSGRVSNLQAGLGDLLQVKAVLEVREGRVAPVGRVRGRKRSLREVIERFRTDLHGQPANIAVVHANAYDEAMQLAEDARAAFEVRELHIVEIGPAIASLIGPGTIGLAGHPVPMVR